MKRVAMSLLYSIGLASAALCQDAARLVQRHGGLESEVLYHVRAVALEPGGLAVVTEPEPAVHLFAADGYRSWGREGGGPAELRDPVDLAWSRGIVHVLDLNQKKIVSFGEDGGFLSSRSLPGEWARRLYVIGEDTILGTFAPMAGHYAVVRLRGDGRDTLFAYGAATERIRLEAEGAPSFTLPLPFTPQVVWAVLPDGTLAVREPERPGIGLIDGQGKETARIPEVGRSWPVTAADREFWLVDAIPSEFMGRRGIFEPIRRKAREVVRFPDRFPPVLELIGDPAGGVWVRKTTSGAGQVWMLVTRAGEVRGTIQFPTGRSLLAVDGSVLAALARDEFDVERIEIYERPGWAR